VIAGVTVGTAAGILLLGWPTADPATRDGTVSLRIAVANLNFANTAVEAPRVLVDLDADLLLILEWSGHNLDLKLFDSDWISELDEPSSGAHGVLILRKRSVVATASLVPTPIAGPCPIPIATARMQVGGRWLSILGAHAPPPIEECEDTNGPTLIHLAGLIDSGRMRSDLGECRQGDPVVLAGDLNAYPWSANIRKLRASGLVDAFARRHWRPTGTWSPYPWFLSFARIDYILVAHEAEVQGSWIVNLPGSDHRVVVADLRLD
jgi:endonuclease/exonuclease/phosphatase (EEP) superfamily protein YafD